MYHIKEKMKQSFFLFKIYNITELIACSWYNLITAPLLSKTKSTLYLHFEKNIKIYNSIK